MSRNAELRRILAQPGIVVLPGSYDAWSAKTVEQAGFPIGYVGGGNVTAGLMGAVDVSWITMTEFLEHVRHIVRATTVPIIADIDTGYGNAINVIRTIREFEAAGVSGVHIEDQILPKRCGHFSGKQVVPPGEMVQKLKAACDTRQDPDFLLIARTDAREPNGLDDAIARANLYAESGADMIFVEAPLSVEELARIGREVRAPLMVNVVEGGKTPQLSAAEYERLGFKVALFPGTTLKVAAWAMREAMRELRRTGTTAGLNDRMLTFDERQALTGLDVILGLEERYLRT